MIIKSGLATINAFFTLCKRFLRFFGAFLGRFLRSIHDSALITGRGSAFIPHPVRVPPAKITTKNTRKIMTLPFFSASELSVLSPARGQFRHSWHGISPNSLPPAHQKHLS